jgi:hypothetical protein
MREIHRFAKPRIWYHSRRQLLGLALKEAKRQSASPWRFFQSLMFSWEFRVHPESFYRYRIFQNWRQRDRYIFHDEIGAIHIALNTKFAPVDSADLSDKRLFERRCQVAGLPCVQTLAEFANGQTVKCSPPPQFDVFTKLSDRWAGEGAAIWNYSDGQYRNGQQSFSFHGLIDSLAAASVARPILLQPCYRNHPDLADISGRALSTIRVVTLKNGGSFHLCAAVFRTSRDQAADNFALGGLAAPIDLITGTLGAAVTKDVPKRPRSYDRHPVGGGTFLGRTIPLWNEVKRLAIRAHQEFSTIPSAGWDIAVTPEGPILVEGNPSWCIDLVQMSHNAPIADGPVPELLLNFIRSHPPGH